MKEQTLIIVLYVKRAYERTHSKSDRAGLLDKHCGRQTLNVLIAAHLESEARDAIDRLASGCGLVNTHWREFTDRELQDFDVLFIGWGWNRTEALYDLVARCKNVKLLQTLSAGVDYIRFSSIPETITVCSNAGAYSEPVAEHAFALIMSLAKNIKANEAMMRQGIFDNKARSLELEGATLGVFGFGGIGREVANIGKALGMRIFAVSRNKPQEEDVDFFRTPDGIDDMLQTSDVVVIASPLTKQTRSLFSKSKLEIMKKDAVLVNVARGQIIVENDLYEHLKENPGFRAGIDTWWNEPAESSKFTPGHDFLSLPNFAGSPHNSGAVAGTGRRSLIRAYENVVRYAQGKKPHNIVNRADYL